jgi:hypothetical protein
LPWLSVSVTSTYTYVGISVLSNTFTKLRYGAARPFGAGSSNP